MSEAPIGCGWFGKCAPVGLATGASSDVNVSYTGQVDWGPAIGPASFSWLPVTTFSGGTVGNAPRGRTNILISGGPNIETDTIRFSKPVKNPVLAIESLGQGLGSNGVSGLGPKLGEIAFLGNPVFAIEAQGPSQFFHGEFQRMTKSGEAVFGEEASGVLQFFGTYSSISFKDVNFKYFTFITVGDEGLAAPTAVTSALDPAVTSVPEASTWAMMLLGFGGLGYAWYRRAKATSATLAT
jgi:hypothetical protein